MNRLLELIKQNPDAEILILCSDESTSFETEWRGWKLEEATIKVEELAYYHGEYLCEEELQATIEDKIDSLIEEVYIDDFKKIVYFIMERHPLKKYITIKLTEE